LGEIVPFLGEDVPLDGVLGRLVEAIAQRGFALPEDGAS
jgi:hypothetical protein